MSIWRKIKNSMSPTESPSVSPSASISPSVSESGSPSESPSMEEVGPEKRRIREENPWWWYVETGKPITIQRARNYTPKFSKRCQRELQHRDDISQIRRKLLGSVDGTIMHISGSPSESFSISPSASISP